MPEIQMQTPAAKALEGAVQRQLGEYGYSNADDPVMAEYVVVMLANNKNADDITQELRELVGEDTYDPAFTKWLFEEVDRHFGGASGGGEADRDAPSGAGESAAAASIPTQSDTREEGFGRRGGGGGRGGGHLFSQAVGGLKRPLPDAGGRDPPPHRRRLDGGIDGVPTGPRHPDPNSDGRPRMNGRDDRGPRGGGRGGRGGGRSLLERTGMAGGSVNPAFHGNGGMMDPMLQMQMMQQQMMMQQQQMGYPGMPELYLANGQQVFLPPGFMMQPQQQQQAPAQAAAPAKPPPDLSTLPKKPDDKECKFNIACKNAWCPNAHVTPVGSKDSLLLSFEPCEKQIECVDKDCTKAHVSPQQKDPAASIWSKPAGGAAPQPTAPAAAPVKAPPHPSAVNPTPCRFGAGCTRPDCVFTHPWNQKAKVAVPCKFGAGCTRADCHFQHPSGRGKGAAKTKNISKTFTEGIGPMEESDESKMNRLKRFGAASSEPAERIIPGEANGAEAKKDGEPTATAAAAAVEKAETAASPPGEILAQ